MRRSRLGALLATATVALTALGWAGLGSAAGAATPATPLLTPVPTPTVACPPALPISGNVSGVTTTSVTISYSMLLVPPCGYDPPITVTLFTSREEAQRWENPVAEGVSGPQRNGTVTIDGLTPDTEYWFRFRAGDQRDPYIIGGPARTAPLAACAATAVIDASWNGGFIATFTVRNVGDEPIDAWRVSWRWSNGERIQSVWRGIPEVVGSDVTVRNASYNGNLAPGGSTTFGTLVSASQAPAGGITATCGV